MELQTSTLQTFRLLGWIIHYWLETLTVICVDILHTHTRKRKSLVCFAS